LARLFISYRRADSQHAVDRLYEALRRHLPKKDIFIDVDTIPKGVDFADHLSRHVSQCETLLAIVGPHWLNMTDETGRRRLDDPDDFVRIEIAAALKRNIPVVPVLLDGTPMPRADQLPPDLRGFERRNAAFLSRDSFRGDMAQLIRDLGLKPTLPWRLPVTAAGVILAAGLGTLFATGVLPPESAQKPVTDVLVPEGLEPSTRAEPVPAPEGFEKGEVFSDCTGCPSMVVIPAGSFTMGSPSTEVGRFDDEGPQRTVTIGSSFAVGRYEVTWVEWGACVADGGCGGYTPENPSGWGKERNPVMRVSWDDAQAYVSWLSRKSGKRYRLLSEAEWEYAARAGSKSRWSFGEDETRLSSYAWYAANSNGQTQPVGTKTANAFGLYDMHGNVWEWTQDCWNMNYEGAPRDGTARTDGDCSRRVVRGGSWNGNPRNLRSANRDWNDAADRNNDVGFRVARTL
jgi:formylglycine-generating enzyme required for sulfatase activity